MRAVRDRPEGSRKVRATLLIAGASAFVLNASVAVHEVGHLIADRLLGLEARIVLNPFGGSYTDLRGSIPEAGWPDAAGPLANLAVGALLFVGLWRTRTVYVLPLLLWLPIALLQESTTALVQLSTQEQGTDFVRLVGAGVPEWAVLSAGAVGVTAGLACLLWLLLLAGVSPTLRPRSRLAVPAVGMGGYPAVAVLVSVGAGFEREEVTRNVGCWRSFC